MKITTLLLFVSTSLYAAHTAAQEAIVNVAATTQTLETLISRIEEQTNYMVVYNSTELNTKQEVTVEHTEGKVKDVLDEALTNTDVAYLFDNDYIILRKKNSDPTVTAVAQQPRGNSVSGIILDATTGDPLIGANIMEKGTTNGVISNVDGRFTLNVQRGAVLVVSYVGFTSQEVTVGNQTNITIRLTEDSDVLDEVVVVGYGTQKRVTVTGSLATTRGDELSQVPTASVTNTLSGRLPGLVAYTRSGEPGADDAGLLIRGISTTGNSDPLIVVDGVAARDGGFSRIDPNDIESITILKDASAAIYGSRAANGVILVTTKRGKAEKVRVSYTGNVGMSYPTVLPKMASSAEYAILYNELVPGTYSDEAIQKYRDGSDPLNYPNVSALDELIRPGLQTRHNVSISGGSNIVQFFASLGYQYQDNYYKNSASNNNQYNFRSNLDITPVKDLKISLDISFREQDRNSPVYNSTDIWRYLIKHRPYTNIFFPGTNYGNAESLQDNFSPATGLDNTMGYQHNRNAYINSGLSVHWDLPWITQGLSVDGAGYFDRSNTFYKSWQHKYYLYNYVDGDYVSRELGSNVLSENMNRNTGITLNARVNYERTFAEVHNVKAFAAYEQFTYRNDYLQARRQDFVSTAVDELFAGDSNSQTNNGTATERARVNFFGRVDYDYAGKYIFQFNWRYDGSENFPKENRFGFFPGVSVGWRASEEAFWKENISWMDYFKLRASWGQMGNDAVDAFQYITAYTFNNPGIFGNGINTGVWLQRTANPNITWEVANTYNVGLETKFLKYWSFDLDLFYTKRTNVLATRNAAVPQYAGLSLPMENIGEMSNRGVEFSLGYNRRFGSDWGFMASGNFSYNRSRIDYIDEPATTLEWQKRTGLPINNVGLMYESSGIFRTQQELDSYPHLSNVRLGDVRFVDTDGNGIINGDDRIRPDKSFVPRINFGINLGLTWRDWSLTALFQGAADVSQYTFMEAGAIGNFTKDFFDNRWTPETPNAKYPRTYDRISTVTGGGSYINTFFLNDASYLRMKSIELGYSLPKSLIQSTFLENVRFSLSGYNLLTFTGFKNLDPETLVDGQWFSGWNTPQSKVINFGVNVTF